MAYLVVLDTDSISVLQNIAAITSFNFECTVSKNNALQGELSSWLTSTRIVLQLHFCVEFMLFDIFFFAAVYEQ